MMGIVAHPLIYYCSCYKPLHAIPMILTGAAISMDVIMLTLLFMLQIGSPLLSVSGLLVVLRARNFQCGIGTNITIIMSILMVATVNHSVSAEVTSCVYEGDSVMTN